MPRHPAAISQADVARAIRAAKQTGAVEVEVCIGEQNFNCYSAKFIHWCRKAA
jgi:hypothetical protein